MPRDRASLEDAGYAFSVAQRALVLEKHGVLLDRSMRTRGRWDRRWAESIVEVLPQPDESAVGLLVEAGLADWESLEKGPVGRRVMGLIRFLLGVEFAEKTMGVYLSLARDTSEDAGQHALDVMGLNRTWRWTTVRDLPRDMFSVRGSKVLQHAHGEHLERLRKIILDATDPAAPRSVSAMKREILSEWGKLNRSQAERIARTESAAVWETTNFNAQTANGVDRFDWVIAHGPSIGPPKSGPVCKLCLDMASKSPYSVGSIELPPRHPNCRCTLIPALEEDWLPPATTWSGGPEPPLPLVEAPSV